MTTPTTSPPYAPGDSPGGASASATLPAQRPSADETHAPAPTGLRVDQAQSVGVATDRRPNDRVDLFGIQIDRVTREQSVAQITQWMDEGPASEGVRYVLTPNVDHVVMLQSNAALRAAYADASLVVADGWPVVRASKWLGKALPERVAGSDLVPRLFCAAAQRGILRVFLLGGMPGVPERAAAHIHKGWKGVDVVGLYSPNTDSRKAPRSASGSAAWFPRPSRTC